MNRLLSWVDWEEDGVKGVDLEAMEFGLRGQMFRLGASLLEALVNRTERGYQGSSMASPDGREARFIEYRIKRVKTVLGEIRMSRAYYYSKEEGRGFFPQDRIWDVEGNGYSPGVKRLVSRIGGQESFAQAGEIVRKEREYFNRNRDRMQYRNFKAQGLFLGSGVIEAGCKAVIGKRLKQSGTRWTVPGANAIIALRRCRLSREWENFWADRAAKREAP